MISAAFKKSTKIIIGNLGKTIPFLKCYTQKKKMPQSWVPQLWLCYLYADGHFSQRIFQCRGSQIRRFQCQPLSSKSTPLSGQTKTSRLSTDYQCRRPYVDFSCKSPSQLSWQTSSIRIISYPKIKFNNVQPKQAKNGPLQSFPRTLDPYPKGYWKEQVRSGHRGFYCTLPLCQLETSFLVESILIIHRFLYL